ncbi:MAG: flagellar type III secretion system pore protein FliP [Christensenellales bacterium]|jgi:flagellar biosynthetic protein FliP
MKKALLVLIAAALIVLLVGCAPIGNAGAMPDGGAGTVSEEDGGLLDALGSDRSESVKILLLITVLAVLPSILIMLTCFPRIIIVLSLVRNGLGLQSMPPNQVLIGLALFLTLFVMSPVIGEINEVAYQPYIENRIDEDQALELAMQPVRNYMLKQTYEDDLGYFTSAANLTDEIQSVDDIPNAVLIPAYMTSEIKRGFMIGFFLYIPFVVIDMIVASVLMSMGMMMLPPTVISLPFKLLLFVMVDGWMLTVQTLIGSFA